MKRINFNDNWTFIKGSSASMMATFLGGGIEEDIQLPHDAMIHEDVTPDTKNGAQTGFYPGGEYVYKKTFFVPDLWKEKTVIVEFEGIYQSAMIYVNGDFVCSNLYGYSGFYADLKGFLKYDEENEIKVISDNSATPNSRWYSGSGIYRNANLILGEKLQFELDSVRIKTLQAEENSAVIEVEGILKNLNPLTKRSNVEIEITRNGKRIASDQQKVTIFPEEKEQFRFSFCITNPD